MRLIDADKRIKNLGCLGKIRENMQAGKDCKTSVIDLPERVPTVDVVEVIHCENCEFSRKNTWSTSTIVPLFCELLECGVFCHNYCCWGERKENETD